MALMAQVGNLIADNKYIGILAKQDFIKVTLAAYESNLPLQPPALLRI
jgi:hypothetical protein